MRILVSMATCLVLTSVLATVGCGGEDTGQGGNGGNGGNGNGGNGGNGNGGAGANGGGGGTGGDPLPEKPTTKFEDAATAWTLPLGGKHEAGFNDLSGEPGSGEDVAFGAQRWRVTDIDGNGTPDLVVPSTAVPREGYYFWNEVPGYNDEKPFWYVYKNKGTGFEEGPIPWFVPAGGQHEAGFNDLSGEPGSGEDVSFGSQRWRLTDIDGNGTPDLVVTATAVPRDGYYFWSEVPGYEDGKPFWYVYKNTGSGFEEGPVPWFVPVGGRHKAGFNDLSGEPGSGEDVSFGSQRWHLTDVDGDGKADLVVTATAVPRDGYYFWSEVPGYEDGKPFWYVYKNTGSGFEQDPIPWFVPVGGRHLAGFNDLSGEPGSGEDVSFGAQRWRLDDIDGDGKADLVVPSTAVPRDGYYFWDEVPGYKEGKPFWYVYKNTGSGFEQDPIPWFVPVGGKHLAGFNDLSGEPGSGEDVSFGAQRWRTIDLTSDGKPDLVVPSTAVPRDGYYFWDEVPGYNDGKPFWYVYKNNGSGYDLDPVPWFVPVGGKHLAGFNDLSGEPGSGEDVSFGSDRWRLTDLDGDARLDLVITGEAKPREGYYFWVEVEGFDTAPLWQVYRGAP